MSSWNEFEFNNPYEGKIINEINGVELPRQYIDFMLLHNGGEGDLGECTGKMKVDTEKVPAFIFLY